MDNATDDQNRANSVDHPIYQVKINGASISPSPLNVLTTFNVFFKNVGPSTANIYGNGPDGEWGTGDIAPGDETYTSFSKDGTYIYSNTEVTGSRAVIIASSSDAEGDDADEEDDNS